jgi:DNA-binding NtrC family response regulator
MFPEKTVPRWEITSQTLPESFVGCEKTLPILDCPVTAGDARKEQLTVASGLVTTLASRGSSPDAPMNRDLPRDVPVQLRFAPRGPERRAGLPALLDALSTALEETRDTGWLRPRFEAAVQQILPWKTLRIRDVAPIGHLVRPAASAAARLESLPIPGGGVLDAELDRAVPLDAWQRQTIESVASLAGLVLEVERYRAADARRHGARGLRELLPPLIGSSFLMQALRHRIQRVAGTDFTILIEGESGSGKELVARQIHALSRRRRGPFVAINCAALVETLLEAELFGIEERTATGVRGRRGKFEYADGGTLFLDEVSDLSQAAQAKLLRAIQDLAVERVGGHRTHRVDTRIIVATNRSLGELAARGQFRADLYYRLSGVEIRVPPLRARREDIRELTEHFLERHRATRDLRLADAAADALATHEWPGNVRELERVIERAVALVEGDEIGVDDLPPAVRQEFEEALYPSLQRAETLKAWACRYARLVLARHGNNKRRTCAALGISYHTLKAYLRGHPRRPRKVARSAGLLSDGQRAFG